MKLFTNEKSDEEEEEDESLQGFQSCSRGIAERRLDQPRIRIR